MNLEDPTRLCLRGSLLLADPSLHDPNFHRTVLLLTEHRHDAGAHGYILNRPFGKTAYAYSLAVLFGFFLIARRIIHSPFGLALRGIRENAARMPAIGAASQAHLRKVYTLSASMAGVAGALLTHTTSTVSLEVLSFGRSADVLVILILGGAGRLYGGILGAIIYMVARDQFSGINPQYWYFWIGLLLVAVVMFLPNGILGGLSALYKKYQ